MNSALFVLAFQILSVPDCDFETAFQKGAEDIEIKSYGANVDRFCSGATDEAKKIFPKYYELGRQYGPTLKKGEILLVPKSQEDLDRLLKEARLSTATKEFVERFSKSPKDSSPNNQPTIQEIQNLSRRIEALEAENKRLTEEAQTHPGR